MFHNIVLCKSACHCEKICVILMFTSKFKLEGVCVCVCALLVECFLQVCVCVCVCVQGRAQTFYGTVAQTRKSGSRKRAPSVTSIEDKGNHITALQQSADMQ